jgi:hypothetical protein
MENKMDRIDRFFKERFANFEQKPEDQVWENIASRLMPDKRKKLTYLFIRIAAGMALLFSLGVGFYLIGLHDRPNMPVVVSNQVFDEEARDSVTVERSQKSNPNQSKKIKTEKSDRLQPVRRIYKGPEIITLQESLQNSMDIQTGQNAYMPGNYRMSGYADVTPMAFITNNNRALIPVPLPARLDYSGIRGKPESGQEPVNALSMPELYANEEQNVDAQSRWMLGSEVAPLYSYRTIASDYLNDNSMKTMNQSEEGLLAYAGGIRVAYAAGKRFSVQSGLYYSRYGQEKNNVEAYTSKLSEYSDEMADISYLSINNSTGTIHSEKTQQTGYDRVFSNTTGTPADFEYNSGFPGINASNILPTDVGDISVTQFFDYLELPVTVKYKIIDRRMDFSVMGGMVTNFLVNDGVILNQNGDSQMFGTTRDINKVNYLGSVGLGLEYPIVRNVAFSLEPRFRYYLNPIDESSQINVHPYSFGVFAGISYSF